MKKLINSLLVFCCLLCPATLKAYDFMVDGIAYRIHNSGNSVSVTSVTFGDNNYNGLSNVIIPKIVTYNNKTFSVTLIDYNAFRGCSSLTNIIIPNSVTSIGSGAFQECTGLTNIIIPNSVTKIGYEAFRDCISLTSVNLPNSATSIEAGGTFYGCSSLTSITIPNSVTSIGNYAFYGCSSLTSITIPNFVTSIGNYAFYGCSSLTSITIPNSVTTIGSFAFDGCNALTSIIIPNSVTTIGQFAFCGCSSLTNITIPNSVTSIGNRAFLHCNGLESIVVGDGNTVYDSRDNCNAIIETASNTLIFGCMNSVVPNSITSIGDWAFEGCTGLTSIIIPNSVTYIGDYAFQGCSGLKSFIIPSSLTFIGRYAFSSTAWWNTQPDGTVYLSKWLIGYKGTMPKGTSVKIKEGTIGISPSAFYGRSGLTSIDIANSVTTIGNYAFCGCSGLTCVDIPNSVKEISHCAFFDCSGLTYVIIPNSVISIGNYAFDGCSSLTSINIPNSITTIRYSTFVGCNSLTGIIIPNSVTAIEESAFWGCSQLKSIEIPNSVTSIGNSVFRGCTGLTSIIIPNSVTSIGYNAFYGCSALTNIYCKIKNPYKVEMGYHAQYEGGSGVFSNCPVRTCKLHVPKGAKSYYKQAEQWKDFTNIIDDIEVSVISGDVNGDEKVNVSDVTALVNMILGVVPKDEDSADVNGDGKVNVSDVTALINIILGINYSNVTATANYSIDFGDDFFKAVDYVVIYYKDNAKIKFDAVSYGTSWRKTVTANQLPGEFGIKWKFYPKVVYDLNMETYNLLSTASISIITSNGGSISDSSEIISDVSTSKANVVETLENANGKSFGYKVSKNGVANRDDNLDYTL